MLFSVIIPAYNAERFILRSVRSVLSQTYADFEVIVVDDGSKDITRKVLDTINDKRLVIISQENQGVSVARNSGISKAQGKFICFLDADDEFLPDHLCVLNLAISEYRNSGFFVTRFRNGLISGEISAPKTSGKTFFVENAVEAMLTNSEIVWTGCVCIKRDLFDTYGVFEPGVVLGEDRDMWVRLFVHTGFVLCDRVTVQRNRDGSEATKHYERRYSVDYLNRMQNYLKDPTILLNVKKSLLVYHECEKLVVVRSYLVDGNKIQAHEEMKSIKKKLIPIKRLLFTYICFVVPSKLMKSIIKMRNKGIYQ